MTVAEHSAPDRRSFLAGAAATGGILLTGCSIGGTPIEQLAARIKGSVIARDAQQYAAWHHSMVWQARARDRHPDIIVQAKDRDDVAEAVRYARNNGLKVTTRAGGHNWNACFLRNGGILIDVSQMQKLEIDVANRRATIGPGVLGRRLIGALGEHRLAFPVAHASSVGVSGFLLGGGIGWNGNAWGGMAAYNIEALEVVTADGNVVQVDDRQNTDLLWSARGGGPGFFGVVTQFTVKTYPLPAAIRSNTYIFPIAAADDVAAALQSVCPQMPALVETTMIVMSAGSGPCPAPGCHLSVIVQSVAFASDEAEAISALAPLAGHAVIGQAHTRIENEAKTFDTLFAGPDGLPYKRMAVDNIYTNDLPATTSLSVRHLETPLGAKASAAMVYKGSPQLAGGACSNVGDFYVVTTIMWDSAEEDLEHERWLRETQQALKAVARGSYINEFDQENRGEETPSCYAPAAWRQLEANRRKRDPAHVFHTFLGQGGQEDGA